jgi:hypothetical protein
MFACNPAQAQMASSTVAFAARSAAARLSPTLDTCLPRCQLRGTLRTAPCHRALPGPASGAFQRARQMQSRAAAAHRRNRLAQQVARAQGTAELADLDDFDGQIIDAEVIDNRIPVTVR